MPFQKPEDNLVWQAVAAAEGYQSALSAASSLQAPRDDLHVQTAKMTPNTHV